jgi:hypothetical protein
MGAAGRSHSRYQGQSKVQGELSGLQGRAGKKKVAKEGCRNATVTDAWSAFSGPIRSVIRSRTLATFRASRWAGGTARMRPYGDPIPFGKRLWPQPSLPMICPMEVAGQMTLKPIFYNSRSTLTICYLYAAWRSQCGLRLHVSC